MADSEIRLHLRNDKQFDRVVYAEVLVPDTPNVYGDYWTKEKIREAAYAFMERGFGIDVEHDNLDRTGAVSVVEAFVARDDDSVFVPGAWVVGMKINDDTIWEGVLSGDINGYSYEAMVTFLAATLSYEESGTRAGTTEADPIDGHTHEYLVIVDEAGRTKSGGTSETNGHSHTISGATVTDEADGHTHRFNIVKGTGGI